MKQRVGQAILLLVYLRLALGCASIIHGTEQDIAIFSYPDGADVWIDGVNMVTPIGRVTLSRKNDYSVVIKKEGYRDVMVKIEGTTSPLIIGNLASCGIGCIIDLSNGAAFDLEPGRLDIKLTKISALDGKTIDVDQAVLDNLKEIRFLDSAGNPEVVVQFVSAN